MKNVTTIAQGVLDKFSLPIICFSGILQLNGNKGVDLSETIHTVGVLMANTD